MCQSGINDHKVKIKSSSSLCDNVISMWLNTDGINFKPGQFLMLEVPGTSLRRPFVIVDKNDKDIRIVFKIRGKGTRLLAELAVGTELKALAPPGNSFPEPPKDHIPLLLGGGIGGAPQQHSAQQRQQGPEGLSVFMLDCRRLRWRRGQSRHLSLIGLLWTTYHTPLPPSGTG